MPRALESIPPIDADQIHSSLEANYDKLFGADNSPETRTESPAAAEPAQAGAPSSEASTDEHPVSSDAVAGHAPGESPEETPFRWDEFTEKHPELLPLAKQLQADYTRKSMELAETRKTAEAISKQFEGLPDEVKAFNDEIAARYRVDPSGKLAHEFVIQIAQHLQSGGAPAASPDPWNVAPQQQPAATPAPYGGEPVLTGYDLYGNPVYGAPQLSVEQQRIQQLEREKAQIQREQNLAVFKQRADTEFNKLEAKYGAIPEQDRKLAWLYMQSNELPNPWISWRVMKADELEDKAAAKAREETAAIQTQKANMAPTPSTAPNRSAPNTDVPKTLEAKVAANYERFWGRS